MRESLNSLNKWFFRVKTTFFFRGGQPLYCYINGVLKLLLSTELKTENIHHILLKLINSSRARVETLARKFLLILAGRFLRFLVKSVTYVIPEGFCN